MLAELLQQMTLARDGAQRFRSALDERALQDISNAAATNWSVAWHQDRTIAVMERVDVEGFGPWTVKSGLLHVAPLFDLLAGMLTLRVHLDPVPETNAPLLVGAWIA
jgi:hypothetical protein